MAAHIRHSFVYQAYDPLQHPTRVAFLNYKNLASGKTYCQYKKNDPKNPTDCKPVPASIMAAPLCDATNVTLGCVTSAQKQQYLPALLPECP